VIDGATEVEAFVGDPAVRSVVLYVQSARETSILPMTNKGRGVWTGSICADEAVRYWIEAEHPTLGVIRAPESTDQAFSAIAVVK
ncbi:MAG: hypothetical protein ACRDHN_21520, partial [Thermomicrobiales bacterium]